MVARGGARRSPRRCATDPTLQLVAVLPHLPDQDGRLSLPPNAVRRERALRDRCARPAATGSRLYGIENAAGTPVYVHAKVCIVDDLWATVGSDNLNRRSWTYDSELTAAVWDESTDGASPFAVALRRRLAVEHLGLDEEQGDAPGRPAGHGPGVRRVGRPVAGVARRWAARPSSGRPAAADRHAAAVTTRPGLGGRLYDALYDPDGRRRESDRRANAPRVRARRERAHGERVPRRRSGARHQLSDGDGRTPVPAHAPPAAGPQSGTTAPDSALARRRRSPRGRHGVARVDRAPAPRRGRRRRTPGSRCPSARARSAPARSASPRWRRPQRSGGSAPQASPSVAGERPAISAAS